MVARAARNNQELELLRTLGMKSVIIVPFIVQEKVIGTISFVMSESGKHFSEADLAMAKEVAARAALAIENARLYSEAQKAISLRDDFISIASHELRTPVTSLKLYIQVLQKQLADRGEESLARSFAKMDAQLNKLTLLIQDLLNVSRIELGKLEFQEDWFDLNKVVKESVEQVQPTTRKHHIRIEGKMARPVWGDADRIGQVLTNLLTNAVKYSPNADTIFVRLTEAKDGAVVSVQDFGIGIEKEHLAHIFDRFYRVNDPEEKTYPGLGIGLHIAHEIIKGHDGTLTVESEKGQGSLFSFILPERSGKSPARDAEEVM
jgi:signal transduction histidine kinase